MKIKLASSIEELDMAPWREFAGHVEIGLTTLAQTGLRGRSHSFLQREVSLNERGNAMKTCQVCDKPLQKRISTFETRYHYTEGGLSDVYLIGVDVYSCESCGLEVANIPNPEGLHFVLARDILLKPVAMTGEEFRFLRKAALKKPREFAQLLGVDPKTIQNWERSESLNRQSDITVRFVVADLLARTHPLGQLIKDIAIPNDQDWLSPSEAAMDSETSDLAEANVALLRHSNSGWEAEPGDV